MLYLVNCDLSGLFEVILAVLFLHFRIIRETLERGKAAVDGN